LGIGLAIFYFFIPALFILCVALIIIYIIYRINKFIRWKTTPKGKRIKHKLLRSHLNAKYGKEGDGIYKEMVSELKKEGYR
jgi:hypothetical protein